MSVYISDDFNYGTQVTIKYAVKFYKLIHVVGTIQNLKGGAWTTNSIKLLYDNSSATLAPPYDVPIVPGSINSGTQQVIWNLSLTPQGGFYGFFPNTYSGVVVYSITYVLK